MTAQEFVRRKYPHAEVVRSTFGWVVYTDSTHTKALGSSRAYWEEEAWVSAANEVEE